MCERERERQVMWGWEGGCVVSGNCHCSFLVTILQCHVSCHSLTHNRLHYILLLLLLVIFWKINATKQRLKYIKLIWSDHLLFQIKKCWAHPSLKVTTYNFLSFFWRWKINVPEQSVSDQEMPEVSDLTTFNIQHRSSQMRESAPLLQHH